MKYGTQFRSMYQALIFDLDDTLYSEKIYFEGIFRVFIETKPKLFETLTKKTIDESIKSINSISQDILGDILKYLNIYSKKLQEELFNFYKNASFEIQIPDYSLDVILKLKAKGIKLGIITNGVIESQKNKITLLKLQDLFDDIIIAREQRAEKPHPSSFLQSIKNLQTSVKHCLFVGDTYDTDIKGSLGVGMDCAWLVDNKDTSIQYLKDNSKTMPSYMIENLGEVLQYV